MATIPQTLNGHNHLVLQPHAPAPACPEATHSVNVFFDVDGYGKAQATGRGNSAKEAAANLLATMQETRAALAPQPVVPQKVTIGELLTCGLKKATAKQDWGLVERLTKAAALVLSGAVNPGERAGMLTVQSEKTPTHWYEVDGTACSCKDYEHRHQDGDKAYYCKHGLAAMLYTRLQA